MLSLRGMTSSAAVSAAVAGVARSRREGEWIVGRGWDQNTWSPPEFPTHKVLDAAVPAHPVALRRIDGHALWANLAAMRAAGISRDTKDPSGGRLLRDASGEPTGVFIDRAMDLIEAKVPADTPEVRERKILAAADKAIASGLTAVHEMGINDATVSVYRSLAAAGRLKLRVYAFLSGEGQIDTLSSRKPDIDADGTAMFVLRAVKLYADGALGSRGAALLEPYADEPGNRGLVLMSKEELERAARVASAAGFQLGVHAIGDRANRIVLDAFEAAGQGQSGGAGRFRIEHAQVVSPEDIPRFAKLGVIASMQPTHATSDMPWADERLGSNRLPGAYAWRSILAAGAHIAGGSDFPVEEVSPLLGLYAAVTRQDTKGLPPGGWLPDQRLTVEEALRIFTLEPAWASFVENHRGRIAPRFIADLTVFDREFTDGRAILDTRVDLTMVGGRIVYERPR
jgi:hypothetical protein